MMRRVTSTLTLTLILTPTLTQAGDASEMLRRGELSQVDLVVGLHACGGLSDLIVAHAVAQGAAFVVCTCCFMSNRHLRLPPPSMGGDAMSREEWLGIGGADADADGTGDDAVCSADDFAIALRCAERQHDPHTADAGAHSVNAIRAAAAERQSGGALKVELVSFSPKFSPRNFIVVGRRNSGTGSTTEISW